ncbi:MULTISPECIES: YbaM family protein [unclassified Shewanella]|uniref:YbaM family protein n=1 Tax=unclassified Shewanella TaxID=196818 RepID=UPI000C81A4B7|nr:MULTISPECIES: YbaM family protein [unclassified Shewanella]MDO6617964.1 YbaM family protein [Shewanella sp. 6_MG-2023]MDO6678260.1 YbaM family protein [Shewanella sp. 4_MG-2023]
MTTDNPQPSPLNDAPKSIQLAVDLIQLLEENKIDTTTAIEALQITLADFKKKQQQGT